MNKRDAKKFEKLLLAERDHLVASIRGIEENTLYETTSENGGDFAGFAEAGTDNFERETALHIASGESQWLQDVTDALKRITSGSYGECEGCSKDISVKRLEAFPSARFCIECQSKREKYGAA
ncbi:MAG: TraR/DksA family transcriptional regulator [Candidatus Hydrogenedentes bacterium]|nr:TraR/DksA family transcriptional regulator [Candidatus Hydrogenedentota bacterium]